jgi:beta-aspartyl-peptidase (threonine type)
LGPGHTLRSEPAADESKASKAIRKVIEDQQAAWNQGKLEEFMAGYWKSEDLSFFSGGDKTRSWQATLERYQKKYQRDGKEMGTLDFSELDVSVIGPDDALVRGRWNLKFKDGKTAGGLFTLWFRQLPDGWRIVHDHTSAG